MRDAINEVELTASVQLKTIHFERTTHVDVPTTSRHLNYFDLNERFAFITPQVKSEND